MGSLSGSPAFWQATSDRLLSPERQRFLSVNGVRFATIEASAWPPLKAEIERHAGVMSQISMVRGTGRAEIAIRSTASQTLFFFGEDGRLQGRSFENSENFWGLRFSTLIRPSGARWPGCLPGCTDLAAADTRNPPEQ